MCEIIRASEIFFKFKNLNSLHIHMDSKLKKYVRAFYVIFLKKKFSSSYNGIVLIVYEIFYNFIKGILLITLYSTT